MAFLYVVSLGRFEAVSRTLGVAVKSAVQTDMLVGAQKRRLQRY